jgi:hypothetical protein
MTPEAVRAFLEESPFPPARRKRRSVPAHRDEAGNSLIIGVLVRDVPAERRREAVLAILDTLTSIYDESGTSPPSWFDTMRVEVRGNGILAGDRVRGRPVDRL